MEGEEEEEEEAVANSRQINGIQAELPVACWRPAEGEWIHKWPPPPLTWPADRQLLSGRRRSATCCT